MATTTPGDAPHRPQSEFEQRRAALVGEIGDSLEQVLAQMNALNRSLEGIITIGNEFAAVEALWSQFENVMGREGDDSNGENANAAEVEVEGEGQETQPEIKGKDLEQGSRS